MKKNCQAASAIPAFFSFLAIDTEHCIGDGSQAFMRYFFIALHALTIPVLAYPQEGGINSPQTFQFLRTEGFDHLAVYVVRRDIGKILGIHAFNHGTEIRIGCGDRVEDELFLRDEKLPHLFYEVLVHDNSSLPWQVGYYTGGAR